MREGRNQTDNDVRKNNRSDKGDRRWWRWSPSLIRVGYEDYEDAMPEHKYYKWQRECINEMWRLLRDDGAIFYNHKWRVKNKQIVDCREIVKDFKVRQIIIRHRPSGSPNHCNSLFTPSYEVIYLIAKPNYKVINRSKKLQDVWSINFDINTEHPAPFPVAIPYLCIGSSVPVGEKHIVLDPFMGSGTTAIAAEQLGQTWLGIEKSEQYIQMAHKRIESERAQMKLF